MKLATTALLFGLATLGAHAQTVYRCGNTYSQEPCPQARLVDADDARTPDQQSDARSVAADERRLAAEMRRDRLAEQASQKPALATSLSGAPVPVARPVSVVVTKQRAKKRHPAVKPRKGS